MLKGKTGRTMDRRTFLKGGAAAAGLAAGGLGGSLGVWPRRAWGQAAGQDARPNILFCLGDDWGWPHCGALGDKVVRTPTFDRVAGEGVLFPQAFCTSPSCTPSRASILTGQMFYRLGESGNLWSTLDKKHQVYPDLLEAAGYHVGLTRKGWGPGDATVGGWKRNPAGPAYRSFDAFFNSIPAGKPFCFWFGIQDPHRTYDPGTGASLGVNPDKVFVPPILPDAPEVRSDILDYYFEIQRADRESGQILDTLEKAGKLENTIVVMSGDNGWPFPRGKTNLYDLGVRQPLAIRWPAGMKGGRVVDDMISLCDLAPTFMEAAGLKPLPEMTARSFLGVLTSNKSGQVDAKRDRVVVGRERHVGGAARPGGVGYPMRALRTRQYKYIRNFAPDRWPVGDPPVFADCDNGPTKAYMLAHAADEKVRPLHDLCFGKRPAEELYDLSQDPFEMKNLAAQPSALPIKQQLATELETYLRTTGDPRIIGGGEKFDQYPRRPAASRPAAARAR